jgi:hypothetical protein
METGGAGALYFTRSEVDIADLGKFNSTAEI